MRYKILLLLFFITQITSAQTENDKIEKGIKMGYFINNNTIEDVIKEYGNDYSIKAKTSIDELTPYISDKNSNISNGAILAIAELNYSLCLKAYEANRSSLNAKMLDDLIVLKKSLEAAFVASAKSYNENSTKPTLSFNNDLKKYEFDNGIIVNTCLLLRYYYGSDNPVYLQTIASILKHIVARSTSGSKFATYYDTQYLNFLEKYDLIVDIYNQIDAQKFDKKTKEELKWNIKMGLPWFDSKEISNKKFENTKHLLRYFEGITKREEISRKEDSINNVKYTSFNYSEVISSLHTLKYKFYTLNKKEPIDNESKEWFNKSASYYYNYYLDQYDAITAKKKYTDCYNPWTINQAYAPGYTLKNIKTFDITFQKKYLTSLLNTLHFAASNNKKWEDRFNSSYAAELKTLLNALQNYYTEEKDDTNITKVNNCLTILKEEPANSGEIREALMAL